MNIKLIEQAAAEEFPVRMEQHPVTKKPFDANQSKREVMIAIIKAICKYANIEK